jgi:purine-binding chemotaxis protein CheW
MELNRRKTMSGERFLSFALNNEEYCIEIGKVREIMGMVPISTLPQTPDFIKGVINLRGRIVPIIDLRTKFGMAARDYTDRTCIIVVDLPEDEEIVLMGIVVDAIHEVVGIPIEKISAVAYVNTRVKSEYIKGIAEAEKGIRIILDIAKVLSDDEINAIKTVKTVA